MVANGKQDAENLQQVWNLLQECLGSGGGLPSLGFEVRLSSRSRFLTFHAPILRFVAAGRARRGSEYVWVRIQGLLIGGHLDFRRVRVETSCFGQQPNHGRICCDNCALGIF